MLKFQEFLGQVNAEICELIPAFAYIENTFDDLLELNHKRQLLAPHIPFKDFLRSFKQDKERLKNFLVTFDRQSVIGKALKNIYNISNLLTKEDFIYERLISIGFDVVKPKGAFYVMPSVKNFDTTGAEFSTRVMKETGVAIVPGNIFGSHSNDKVRMSYATELNKLKEAMDRIEKLVKE